jgi:hypothetical protein
MPKKKVKRQLIIDAAIEVFRRNGLLEHIVTRWLLKGEKGDLLAQCNDASELLIQGISDPAMLKR